MILKWKNIKEKVMIRIKQSRGKIINLDNNEITYYYYRIIYLKLNFIYFSFKNFISVEYNNFWKSNLISDMYKSLNNIFQFIFHFLKKLWIK